MRRVLILIAIILYASTLIYFSKEPNKKSNNVLLTSELQSVIKDTNAIQVLNCVIHESYLLTGFDKILLSNNTTVKLNNPISFSNNDLRLSIINDDKYTIEYKAYTSLDTLTNNIKKIGTIIKSGNGYTKAKIKYDDITLNFKYKDKKKYINIIINVKRNN